jgi:hypothetical protein
MCQSETRKGKKCKNLPVKGSIYCKNHIEDAERKKILLTKVLKFQKEAETASEKARMYYELYNKL